VATYLENLGRQRAEFTDLANGLMQTAADEDRTLSDDERASLEKWQAECQRLDGEMAQVEKINTGASKFAEAVAARQAKSNAERDERRVAVASAAATSPGASTTEAAPRAQVTERRSMGQVFVDSDAFRNYKSRGGHGASEAVEFDDFLGTERRAAIMTPDLEAVIPPHTGFAPLGYTTSTPLLDAIGRERVSSGTVTWVDWGSSNPIAGKVPEGDVKPEAALAPTEVALNLDTFAHWKAVSRQALEDYARIRSIIEGKLRGGLEDALEQGAATALTTATTIPDVAGEDLLTGIRLGIASTQESGFVANTVLLNPADFAALDIQASEQAANGPISFGRFWGLAPVAAGAVPEGTAYVGDFRAGVTWFDRGTASVYMTDSHADYFVRNLLVILAETRAAFAVTDPLALAKVTATPPAGVTAKASK
jgi:HK97 family phage major capsid protein